MECWLLRPPPSAIRYPDKKMSKTLLIGPAGAGFWGGVSTDATRLIDVAGGRLVVAGDITATTADDLIYGHP